MEDVVLHLHGRAEGLRTWLETTEKLLEPFTCRPPPVFTPWFPDTAAERPPPIRPAKRAPVLSGGCHSHSQAHGSGVCGPDGQDGVAVSTSSRCSLPPPQDTAARSPDKKCVKCSWSVLTSRVSLQHSPSVSKRFRGAVSLHGLHPRQRSKWVISRHNCGQRDIEQVWRAVTVAMQRSGLATCNANIQRECAEIWVFCDVAYAEPVGRLLKERLELSGSIRLVVHKLGSVFSL
ncbi:shieldin complex subunit 3 [Dunckerocampus dactyliophorus]|uniref:shieldin complex subunit 3 n=1 Tax=Dunckerocampus dactyliophorus TaxID=161453 RepID=UPI002405FC20|nr:shieldin complex subunit 3 [Dunckerocampus dactyliophorus]XP_054630011.1 shieldin complex subunit 3 [Dunckerocampus dactyliophorus]XP_054630012.1 shieldin complex subunit 3 [Dunckerocampus dactyliophorus]XP_054630013.1 shieldin complex subunit 3 [Dunckerocampus dactyliophorus]